MPRTKHLRDLSKTKKPESLSGSSTETSSNPGWAAGAWSLLRQGCSAVYNTAGKAGAYILDSVLQIKPDTNKIIEDLETGKCVVLEVEDDRRVACSMLLQLVTGADGNSKLGVVGLKGSVEFFAGDWEEQVTELIGNFGNKVLKVDQLTDAAVAKAESTAKGRIAQAQKQHKDLITFFDPAANEGKGEKIKFAGPDKEQKLDLYLKWYESQKEQLEHKESEHSGVDSISQFLVTALAISALPQFRKGAAALSAVVGVPAVAAAQPNAVQLQTAQLGGYEEYNIADIPGNVELVSRSNDIGIAASGRDINGDGADDLVVVASASNAIYAIYGQKNAAWPSKITLPDYVSTGAKGTTIPTNGSVASIAMFDINRDGIADLVVGFPGYDKAVVYCGGSQIRAGCTIQGVSGSSFGTTVGGNDQFLIIGGTTASPNGKTNAGITAFIPTRQNWPSVLNFADITGLEIGGTVFNGENPGDQSGSEVGLVEKSGATHVIIGASQAAIDDLPKAGKVFIPRYDDTLRCQQVNLSSIPSANNIVVVVHEKEDQIGTEAIGIQGDSYVVLGTPYYKNGDARSSGGVFGFSVDAASEIANTGTQIDLGTYPQGKGFFHMYGDAANGNCGAAQAFMPAKNSHKSVLVVACPGENRGRCPRAGEAFLFEDPIGNFGENVSGLYVPCQTGYMRTGGVLGYSDDFYGGGKCSLYIGNPGLANGYIVPWGECPGSESDSSEKPGSSSYSESSNPSSSEKPGSSSSESSSYSESSNPSSSFSEQSLPQSSDNTWPWWLFLLLIPFGVGSTTTAAALLVAKNRRSARAAQLLNGENGEEVPLLANRSSVQEQSQVLGVASGSMPVTTTETTPLLQQPNYSNAPQKSLAQQPETPNITIAGKYPEHTLLPGQQQMSTSTSNTTPAETGTFLNSQPIDSAASLGLTVDRNVTGSTVPVITTETTLPPQQTGTEQQQPKHSNASQESVAQQTETSTAIIGGQFPGQALLQDQQQMSTSTSNTTLAKTGTFLNSQPIDSAASLGLTVDRNVTGSTVPVITPGNTPSNGTVVSTDIPDNTPINKTANGLGETGGSMPVTTTETTPPLQQTGFSDIFQGAASIHSTPQPIGQGTSLSMFANNAAATMEKSIQEKAAAFQKKYAGQASMGTLAQEEIDSAAKELDELVDAIKQWLTSSQSESPSEQTAVISAQEDIARKISVVGEVLGKLLNVSTTDHLQTAVGESIVDAAGKILTIVDDSITRLPTSEGVDETTKTCLQGFQTVINILIPRFYNKSQHVGPGLVGPGLVGAAQRIVSGFGELLAALKTEDEEVGAKKNTELKVAVQEFIQEQGIPGESARAVSTSSTSPSKSVSSPMSFSDQCTQRPRFVMFSSTPATTGRTEQSEYNKKGLLVAAERLVEALTKLTNKLQLSPAPQ